MEIKNEVSVRFWTSKECRERVKRLAKATGHSASFLYRFILERYLDEVETSFLAGEDVKDTHLKHFDEY